MATAIVDWDLDDPTTVRPLAPRYERAMVLVRMRGRPIERLIMKPIDGKIALASVLARLDASARWIGTSTLIEDALLPDRDAKRVRSPSATVAICTRDRPADLRRCLQGISRLQLDGQEILVIDNNPSDDRSRHMANEFDVRYVLEPRPGLNHARNRALREAHGDIVAFIDDDATPDPLWLRALLRNFESYSVACVTGLTMPWELETEAQEMFEEYTSFVRGFHRKEYFGLQESPLAVGMIGSGVNMAVRRSIAEIVGGFDNTLDAGTPTQSGGDHEMYTRMLSRGFRIVYEPEAINWHRHRATDEELRKAIYGYGVGVYSALTRALLVSGEIGALRIALLWFKHVQARRLVRVLTGKASKLDRLVLIELKGCLHGPLAYVRSLRRLKKTKGERYA